MNRIKFDGTIIKFISIFETVTHARVKDCINEEDNLLFIVEQGEAGKAIGKAGMNIKKVGSIIKKNIRVIEYNEDVAKFIRNMLYPIEADSIEVNDGSVIIRSEDRKKKGQIFGRERTNLKRISDIVCRYFDLKEIRVE